MEQNACSRWHFIRKFPKMQSCTPDRLKTFGVRVLIYLGCSKLIQTLCFYPQESYKQARRPWERVSLAFFLSSPLSPNQGFFRFLASRATLMASSASQVHHTNYWKTPRRISEVPGHLSKLLKDKEVSSSFLSSLLFPSLF